MSQRLILGGLKALKEQWFFRGPPTINRDLWNDIEARKSTLYQNMPTRDNRTFKMPPKHHVDDIRNPSFRHIDASKRRRDYMWTNPGVGMPTARTDDILSRGVPDQMAHDLPYDNEESRFNFLQKIGLAGSL